MITNDAFTVTGDLKTLGNDLKCISSEMLNKYKIPVIEQDILKKTTDLFEYEIKWLRPESPDLAGKDRVYIKDLLQKLFRNNNHQNWRSMAEKDVPYIPNLIDAMLANRKLNERATITLDRAKRVSEFHPHDLDLKIIAVCLKTHLEGVPDLLAQQITNTIQHQRGPRYYAVQAAHQWANDTQGDGGAGDDDADEDDDQDGHRHHCESPRPFKKMRKAKSNDDQ